MIVKSQLVLFFQPCNVKHSSVIVRAQVPLSGAAVFTLLTLSRVTKSTLRVHFSSFFRSFCIYAALATTFAYVMMITFFVAVMTFDVKRIKSGRRDCLPVCQAPQPKDGEAPWDEPRPQSSNRIMKSWSTFLMHPASKFFVLILSIAALSMGIYGTTKVTERLVTIQ